MKLYSADLSPYSARVRMQIYAKGIKDIVFELPEHWGMPKFRERFPIGRIPVLDIDGDIYIINNMFMLSRQTGVLSHRTPTAARNDGVSEQLASEVVQNLKALDKLVGKHGFACCGRITLADCALVPGLFFVENVMPAAGLDTPIPTIANVAAYWAAIQKNEHAATVLIELRRGLEERRQRIRSGALERFRAERDAAQKAADTQN
jgi:glutathione S-transferase